VQDAPTVVADEEKAVVERDRRCGEEVHRRYGLTVVAQERLPPLGRIELSLLVSSSGKR
jgi:hypothetical protein